MKTRIRRRPPVTGIRTNLRATLLRAMVTAGIAAVALPATAAASTASAPPTRYASVAGLPDGRHYELVTPANKYGNEVSVYGFRELSFGVAAADGDGILYEGQGPLAEESVTGNGLTLFTSQRSSHGWVARSATPRGAPGIHEPEENEGLVAQNIRWFEPSLDLSQLAFAPEEGADVGPPAERGGKNNFYLTGSNPFVEPTWLARPQMANAIMGDALFPAGGSPDLSSIYFMYDGQLLAGSAGVDASGLYEYRDGVLSDAGTLPAGEASTGPAMPANQLSSDGIVSPAQLDNQVSSDGSRIFFVRADSTGATELYVHITGPDGAQRTALVSQSQLQGHEGEPAPDGPEAMPAVVGPPESTSPSPPSYVYASSDGRLAFFQSIDQLTGDAPVGNQPKQYEFDVDTGTLAYLPGVEGPTVAAAPDGSWLLFEKATASLAELEMWSEGPSGGTVTPVVQLPQSASSICGIACAGPAKVSPDGSTVVFTTESPIAGFNDGGGFQQVFRYDVAGNVMTCISCPPLGIAPSGDAVLSNDDYTLNVVGGTLSVNTVVDDRNVSPNGQRVFFNSPDALVPQDINGRYDVYEWENGTVYMISSGTTSSNASLLDSSESGNDVFFTTTTGLVQSDNDGARDVYDARIPRPGDIPPPSALPCQGDVCQGPPSVSQLLGVPASASFDGLGNVEAKPEAEGKTKATKKRVRKQTAARRRRVAHRRRHGGSARAHRHNGKGKR